MELQYLRNSYKELIQTSINIFKDNFRGRTFQITLHDGEIISIQLNEYQFMKLLNLDKLLDISSDVKEGQIQLMEDKLKDYVYAEGQLIAKVKRICTQFISLYDLTLDNIHSVIYNDKNDKVYANLIISDEYDNKLLVPLYKRDMKFVPIDDKEVIACTIAGFNKIDELPSIFDKYKLKFPERVKTIGTSRVNGKTLSKKEIENREKIFDNYKYVDADIDSYLKIFKKTSLQ